MVDVRLETPVLGVCEACRQERVLTHVVLDTSPAAEVDVTDAYDWFSSTGGGPALDTLRARTTVLPLCSSCSI